MNIFGWWNIADDSIAEPFLIFAHFYGLTREGKLPESSKHVLYRAVQVMQSYPQSRLFLVTSNYLGEGKMELERSLKIDWLKRGLIDMSRVIDEGRGVRSTIDEIGLTNKRFDLAGQEVVAVCDRIHARRVRYFWRKLAPLVNVKIAGITGVWDSAMPSFWQQSDLRWLACNMIHSALFFLGFRSARLGHKVNCQ